MSRHKMMVNFLMSLIYAAIIPVGLVTDSLVCILILFVVSATIFTIHSKIKLKRFRHVLSSPAYIFGMVFVPYAVLAILVFILDGYKSRINYFSINSDTMLATSKLYLIIYLGLLILLTLFSAVKKFDISAEYLKIKNRVINVFSGISLLDVLAGICLAINMTKLIGAGGSYFQMSTLEKRSVFSSDISHYINTFMVVYSLLVSIYVVEQKRLKKQMIPRLAILACYWGIYLTCERRMFVAYLLGLLIISINKFKKVTVKHVIASVIVVSVLLFSASLRANITMSNHKFSDVLYMSFTEFVCTYSISNYYVNNIDTIDLAYGESYFRDSFTSLIPRAIYEEKPIELGTQFKKDHNLNVGYSFNPIAEGIHNYGKLSVVVVPIVIFLIVLVANKAYRFNILMPIIISSFSIDFYRGQFANFFFDSLFCFVLIYLIFKIKRRNMHKEKIV